MSKFKKGDLVWYANRKPVKTAIWKVVDVLDSPFNPIMVEIFVDAGIAAKSPRLAPQRTSEGQLSHLSRERVLELKSALQSRVWRLQEALEWLDDKDCDKKPMVWLDPEAPGLDEETRQRRRALLAMRNMSSKERMAIAVKAGIYTEDGQLTEKYRHDNEKD